MSEPTPADNDLRLLAEIEAGPTVEEAQSSLRYWRERRSSLPFYRRQARREADRSIRQWSQRLREARRRRYGPSVLDRGAEALGLDTVDARRIIGRAARRLALAIALLVAAAAAAAIILWPELEPIVRLFIQVGGQ